MTITPQITVAVRPEYYKSKLKMGALEAGSILKVKIVGLQGDRALIDFGNFRSTAEVKIPVHVGEELTVRVLETGRKLTLGLINADAARSVAAEFSGRAPAEPSGENLTNVQRELTRLLNAAVAAARSKNIPSWIYNILERLNAYFQPFGLEESGADILPRLKSHLESSGIFFEKSLEGVLAEALADKNRSATRNLADLAAVKAAFNRDLKPNLLLLLHAIEQKQILPKFLGPQFPAEFKGVIDNLLSDITHQQNRAVGQLESPDPFQVFSFSLPLKADDGEARLNVFFEKKRSSGAKQGFLISLLLSMGQLGAIRADLYLLEKDLSIHFYVTEPATLVKLQDHFQELEDTLGDLFDHLMINATVSEKKVMDFDRPDLQLDANRKVDVRI